MQKGCETYWITQPVSYTHLIITGVNGEKYPCKPDIFRKTYELLENC